MGEQQLIDFENRHWESQDQRIVWRHRIALQLVQEEPVLDLGGGDGLFLELLRQRGFKELKLLDISPIAVEKAKAKGLNADVFDITKPLPFADDFFGTVCALDVLEHLFDPLFTLKEMARVGRSVVIVVPNFQHWRGRLDTLIGKVPPQCKPKRGHVYWFNYSIFHKIIQQANLQVDTLAFGGHVKLGPFGNWLARLSPNLFAHSFAARLRKKSRE
jgi:methionine biosynthesis protein MetW